MIESLSPESIVRMFTSSWAANWHPLTWLSHAIDRAFFGLAPAGHHAVSLALHAANAALVFVALRALTGAAAKSAVVALLFAVHPLRAESVAWVSERKDLLCAFFFLLALRAHAKFPASRSRGQRAALLLFAALALLAKPMAVTLPVVLLLLDAWPLRRLSWSAAREKLPLFALSAAAAAATLRAQSRDLATASLAAIPLRERAANAAVSAAAYLGESLWPDRLSPFTPFPGHGGAPPLSAVAVAGSAALLAAISAAVILARRRSPYLAVGWLWYIVMLAPVSGLLQSGSQARADRYTYLTLLGPTIALVWWGAGFLARRRVPAALAPASLAVALGGLSLLSWRQAAVWRDSESLWRRVEAVGPPSAPTRVLLGDALVSAGRLDEAIACCREALSIDPSYEPAQFHLGLALSRQGRGDEAIDAFRAAIAIRPGFAIARYELANRIARRGDGDGAIAEYRRAVRDAPDLAVAHYDLGVLLSQRGGGEEAMEQYRAAVRSRPCYPEAEFNLGVLLLRRGDLAGARRAARRILGCRPTAQQASQAEFLIRECDRAGSPAP